MGAAKGRPTLYKDEYVKLAYNYCLLGATDADLAKYFDATETTVNNWKIEHQDFFESIKEGRIEADTRVVKSLYKRAIGYDQTTDKIFQFQGAPVVVPTIDHIQPDTTAQIFWLKNRQPAKWRDKIEVDQNISGDFSINVNVVNLNDLHKQDTLPAKKDVILID
jgi:hypothetical protein